MPISTTNRVDSLNATQQTITPKQTSTCGPSHADYMYLEKYGVKASSGGGRSSAHETIGWVAARAIAEKYVKTANGIEVITPVSSSACSQGTPSLSPPLLPIASESAQAMPPPPVPQQQQQESRFFRFRFNSSLSVNSIVNASNTAAALFSRPQTLTVGNESPKIGSASVLGMGRHCALLSSVLLAGGGGGKSLMWKLLLLGGIRLDA